MPPESYNTIADFLSAYLSEDEMRRLEGRGMTVLNALYTMGGSPEITRDIDLERATFTTGRPDIKAEPGTPEYEFDPDFVRIKGSKPKITMSGERGERSLRHQGTEASGAFLEVLEELSHGIGFGYPEFWDIEATDYDIHEFINNYIENSLAGKEELLPERQWYSESAYAEDWREWMVNKYGIEGKNRHSMKGELESLGLDPYGTQGFYENITHGTISNILRDILAQNLGYAIEPLSSPIYKYDIKDERIYPE
tara:strand:- start:44 stop:802 length:759 start_codon:yes stop_codon:yes gene_type:complete